MRNFVLLCAITALSVAACGGGDEGTASTATGGSSSSSSGDTTSSSSGSGSSSSSSGSPFVPSPGADKIVINEMNALGTSEWVEIVNTYDKPVSLVGYALADSDAMVGGPDLTNAVRFPDGATLAAGDYLIIVRNAAAETPPVKHSGSDCLSNAPASAACYYTKWEISGKSGEFIYFVDGNDQVVSNAEYPANAVDPLMGFATWARLPDKTGAFAASKTATPGGPNMP